MDEYPVEEMRRLRARARFDHYGEGTLEILPHSVVLEMEGRRDVPADPEPPAGTGTGTGRGRRDADGSGAGGGSGSGSVDSLFGNTAGGGGGGDASVAGCSPGGSAGAQGQLEDWRRSKTRVAFDHLMSGEEENDFWNASGQGGWRGGGRYTLRSHVIVALPTLNLVY